MLWIFALAVLAVLAYVLGYVNGKKVGIGRARREYEAWREMRYCGTALLHMEEVASGIRRHEGKKESKTALRLLRNGEGKRRPGEPG